MTGSGVAASLCVAVPVLSGDAPGRITAGPADGVPGEAREHS
ncbi:hypothetical protein [Streptomyces sp. NPDC046979]